MSLQAWERALAEIEDELDAHEEQVRSGNAVVVPQWEPPTDLGPLPAQLADRVTHLTGRIRLLTTFVQYQLTATESDLAHVRRQQARAGTGRTTNGSIALYLDSSV